MLVLMKTTEHRKTCLLYTSGVGIGTALGVVFDNIAIGVAIGAGLGLVLGTLYDSK